MDRLANTKSFSPGLGKKVKMKRPLDNSQGNMTICRRRGRENIEIRIPDKFKIPGYEMRKNATKDVYAANVESKCYHK